VTADLLITDVEVINVDGRQRGHVAVTGRRISAVLPLDAQLPEARKTLDGQGRLALPGGVDGHCHIAQRTGAYDTLDTYATTSVAALWGGTTTLLDFGIPRDEVQTPLQALQRKRELAHESRCDIGLHGSVIQWDDSIPEQLNSMWAMGVRSVKMYATNRGTTMADPDTMLNVMHEVARRQGLVYLHAEHDAMVVDCTKRHADAGEIGVGHLHRTRPEIVEESSVQELLAMVEYTGVRAYFVHQTTPRSVSLVTDARAAGLDVYSETCPHYLTLDDSVYEGTIPECYSCCPPMRSRRTVDGLAKKAAAGNIDALSSDHSCYDLRQKREHRDDIRRMPHGLPGVETRLPVSYTKLVNELEMPLERFVSTFSTEPARINGLQFKGAIKEGMDADIVLIDPVQTRAVTSAQLHMGTDFSPFEGMDLHGWPQAVISNGRLVVCEGEFEDPGPTGRYLHRQSMAGPVPDEERAR